MTTLILDTSTDLCIVALAKEGTLLGVSNCLHQNHLSKILLPCIQALLQDHQITPSVLKGIALGIGPGSYTGTRLGASVAKTLGFALNIPLYPFLSPCAFIPSGDGSFAFLIETKPGPYFVLKGTLQENKLHQEEAGLIDREQLFTHVETTDFLILPMATVIPPGLEKKSTVRAAVNLPLLASFLLGISPSSAEQIALEYLHTPFLS